MVGHAYDVDGDELTLQVQTTRIALSGRDLERQIAAGLAGIGRHADQLYLWAQAYGLGVSESPALGRSLTVLPATDETYEVTMVPAPLLGSGFWRFAYLGGEPVGTAGARYFIGSTGAGKVDDVLEMRCGGKSASAGHELYRGTWIGLVLDSGASLVLSSFWQPSDPQWITGRAVGRPPITAFGNLYLPVEPGTWNGGLALSGTGPEAPDFEVDILRPATPAESPHWTSPVSGQTYSNGWRVTLAPAVAGAARCRREPYVVAVVRGAENLLPDRSNAFWEGAADVFEDPDLRTLVGHAFVEQMGFN